MQYFNAKWKKAIDEKRYRVYVTDSLYALTRGSTLSDRWIELLEKKVDTRTGDEVILDVMKNAGLSFKKD